MAATTPAPTIVDAPHSLTSRLIAEAVGTFFLVVAVIGTALFSAPYIGFLAVALAIGLVVLIGAFAFGPISGGHFNPAVTLGVAAAGRLPWRDVLPYIAAQVVGGAVASSLLALISATKPGQLAKNVAGHFASNGFGDLSPDHYNFVGAVIVEVVLTALFIYVILGV
ncbi:MAG: aquaporin, partial [Actinomycetota bacterium]